MDQSNQTPKAPENQERKKRCGKHSLGRKDLMRLKYGNARAAIRLSHGASLCGLQWKPGRHYSPHKSE